MQVHVVAAASCVHGILLHPDQVENIRTRGGHVQFDHHACVSVFRMHAQVVDGIEARINWVCVTVHVLSNKRIMAATVPILVHPERRVGLTGGVGPERLRHRRNRGGGAIRRPVKCQGQGRAEV